MRHNTALLLSLCAFLFFIRPAFSSEFLNTEVTRRIDLTTQLARHTINITAKNTGAGATAEYVLALDEQQVSHLSFVKVTDKDGAELKVKKGVKGADGHTSYLVSLSKKPVDGGDSVSLSVTLVFTHAQKPFPTHITQSEHQLVIYHDNHFFFSPYKTSTQKTEVKLASSNVEDYSQLKPTKIASGTITYGPYSDIAAHSRSELKVHFENNSPFITVTKAVKDIEISHWGNVAIETYFDIRHDGATLKGSFSRFDFQRNPGASPSAVLQIAEVLPNGASDVYYRDDIGNISTSTFRVTPQGTEFYMLPRFPLFGGWKNNFYTGYNLPLDKYLFTDSSDGAFVLKAPFAVDMAGAVIDHLVVRVILPEGAKNYQVEAPFAVDAQSTDKHYSYLDTTGRTVVVIEKHNVVKDHNQNFQVRYHYSTISMLQEPLLVAGAFFAFFLAVMAYTRFEISITKEVKPVADAKLSRAAAQFREHIAKFEQEYNSLLNSYKKLSDAASYKTERSRIVSVYLVKPLTDASNAANALSKTNAALQEKMNDVVGYCHDKLRSRIDLQDLEMEFKAGGSKGKAKYDKEKEEVEKKFEEAEEGIKEILAEVAHYI